MEKELVIRNFKAFQMMLDAEMTITGPIQEFLRTFRLTILKYFTAKNIYYFLFKDKEYMFVNEDKNSIIENINTLLTTGNGNLDLIDEFKSEDSVF